MEGIMPDKKPNALIRNLFSVTGIVLLSKILGFAKQMVTASAFGASAETDILAISSGIMGNMEYVLLQTLITAFLPVYIDARTENTKRAADFTSNFLKLCVLTSCAGVLFFELAAFPAAKLIAPSYLPEATHRLAIYIRIFAPTLLLMTLIAFFDALLRANESFILGALIHLNQSVSQIAVILLLQNTFGINSQVIGFYTYIVVNFLLMAAVSKRHWRIGTGNPLHDPYVKNLLRMSAPLFFGYSMVYINRQVDNILISGMEGGAVTATGYAAVLSGFVTTLSGSSCSIIFPYISKNAAEQKDAAVAELASQSSIMMSMLLLPVSIITILNAQDIVQIVYGRGAFDAGAVSSAAKALSGYALMFAPYAIRDIFNFVHYSYGNSRRPAVSSAVGILFNIVFSILLSRWYGVLGIALASSISVVVTAVLNIISARIYRLPFRLRTFLICVPLWGLGGVVCAILSLSGHVLWSENAPLLRFLFTALLSGFGYLAVTLPVLWPYLKQWMNRQRT